MRDIRNIAGSLSYKSRIAKYNLFVKIIAPTSTDKILYVGGTISTKNVAQESFFFENYNWLENITVVDLDEKGLREAKKCYPQIKIVCSDVKNLPFRDKQFDIAFSNAVIAHVGGFDEQKKMADEIIRVSRRYFIATPNFWFPYECHYHLPFIHYFPFRIQRLLKKFIGGRYPRGKMPQIYLLSSRRLRMLFPESQIIKQKITLFPETLIVFRP